jgi:hypothetical protein
MLCSIFSLSCMYTLPAYIVHLYAYHTTETVTCQLSCTYIYMLYYMNGESHVCINSQNLLVSSSSEYSTSFKHLSHKCRYSSLLGIACTNSCKHCIYNTVHSSKYSSSTSGDHSDKVGQHAHNSVDQQALSTEGSTHTTGHNCCTRTRYCRLTTSCHTTLDNPVSFAMRRSATTQCIYVCLQRSVTLALILLL